MKNKQVFLLGAVAVLILLLIPGGAFAASNFMNIANDFVIAHEGFVDHPYPDNSQYSWGYGTKAPGPTGNITREQARIEMEQHLQQDYDYLSQLIFRSLNANQWAALLDFSYNVGPGNADNLVDNINNGSDGNDAALFAQMRLYNKETKNGVKVLNQNLADRREDEIALWQS